MNLELTWRTNIGDPHLELFLRGNNSRDEEARSHPSLIKEFAPLPAAPG